MDSGLPSWLTASPQSGTSNAGRSSATTLTADPSALASGVLQALVGSIPGRETRPAESGEFISIFCTGLGATSPTVEAGEAGAAEAVTTPVTATIGGVDASVSFAGLAPLFVGLYQVNVVVPGGVETGPAVPLVITQDGIASNTVTIAVE